MKQKIFALMLNGINIIFPVLTVPLVTMNLGLQIYSDFVLSNIVYQLIIAVTSGACLNYFIREYGRAESKGDISRTELLENIFSFQFYSLFLAFLIYFLSALFFNVYVFGHVIFAFSLFSILYNVEWYFYAKQNFKAIFIRAFILRGGALFLVYFFVDSPDDIDLYFIIMSVSMVLYSYSGYYASGLTMPKLSLSSYLITFRRMKYFFSGAVVGIFYQFVDQLIVSMFLPKENLSIYNILKQVTNGLTTLPVTLIRYNMPNAVRGYGLDYFGKFLKKSFFVFISFSVFISFLSFMFIDDILYFLVRDQFSILYEYKIFVASMIFLTSCAVFIDSHLNIPSDNEKITLVANITAVIVMLITISSFIESNGLVGAIYSLISAELTCVLAMFMLISRSKKALRWK